MNAKRPFKETEDAPPRLSIVIPALNEERYLPRLLASIVRQTFRNFEVIVSDASSTDRTREIAEAAGCQVTVGPTAGPACARNLGARLARGDVLLFLDADVVLPTPQFLERTLAEFSRRDLAVATCLARPYEATLLFNTLFGLAMVLMRMLRWIQPRAPGWAIFARREGHEKIGGFDETPALGEDHDYAARMRRHGPYGILRSGHVLVSTRRFQKEGVLRTLATYALFEVLRPIRRLRFDEVHYRFGKHD